MREGRDGFQGPEWRVPIRRTLPGDIPAIPTHPWGNELGQTSLRNPISHPPPTISIFPLKYFNRVRSCRTATAQTDTKRVRCPLDTEEVRAGPSLCLVVLHPKLPWSTVFASGDDGMWSCAFTGRILVSDACMSFQRVSYDSVCQLTVPFTFAWCYRDLETGAPSFKMVITLLQLKIKNSKPSRGYS